MTVADNAMRVENVAAPSLGHGRTAPITAVTPLPTGWGSFCSKPDPHTDEPGRWYATAPYDADSLNQQMGRWCLEQTVHAETWRALHNAVAQQVARYEAITGLT